MAVPKSLKELEEQSAGNADDNLNPGDDHYKRSVASKKGASDEDSFGKTLDDNDYSKNSNDTKKDFYGDEVQRNWNKEREDLEEQENKPDSLFKGSGAPTANLKGWRGHLRATTNRFGPTGGVVFMLLFGIIGLGGGSSFLASSLLVNMKEIFHNDRADATRMNRQYSRAFIANKFNGPDGCKKKTAICTKMSTMSPGQVSGWEDDGFKAKGKIIGPDGKVVGEYESLDDNASDEDKKKHEEEKTKNAENRIQLTEVTYPDGTKVSNGRDLYAHADSNPNALRRLEKAFASKAAFYTNKFFSQNILKGKFNTTKAQAKYPEGDDAEAREKQDAQFDQEGEFKTDEAASRAEGEKIANDILNHAKGVKSATKAANTGGGAVSLIQGVCAVYQFTRMAEAAVKTYHIIQLGKFALMFFKAADQIKDQKGDAPLVWRLADRLTYAERNDTMTVDTDYAKKGEPNPKYNLSATDSEGYQNAAHGGAMGLRAFAERYILGGGIGKQLDSVTDHFEDTADKLPAFAGANKQQKMKNFCRVASGNIAMVIAGCAGSFAALQTLGSVAPGVGNYIGATLSIGICGCTVQGVQEKLAKDILGETVGKVIGIFTDVMTKGVCNAMEIAADEATTKAMELLKSKFVQDKILDILAELNISSKTKGVDAGNAIAAGAGLMLSTTATGYGQQPASSANNNQQISEYIAYTQPLEDRYIALEKQDANNAPFDIDNKYSLIGSVVRSLAPDETPPMTVFGLLSTVPNLYGSSIQMLSGQSTASALYNQPSLARDGDSGRFDRCEDKDLIEIEASGDIYCSIVGITSKMQLAAASMQATTPGNQHINSLIDWMQEEQKESEEKGGTMCETDSDHPGGHCADSTKPSIDETGKPIEGSQYSIYLKYCTDQRKAPWGNQFESMYEGGQRDQDWYRGKQCMNDSVMLRNFRDYTNYCLQSGTMDGDLNCYTKSAASTSEPVASKGDACSLLNNKNVILVQEETKTALKELCETGKATNACGQPFTINKMLFDVITTLSSKYKIWLNNFGFQSDRRKCDGGQHPKGNAIDINGIEKVNGGGRAGGPEWGGIKFATPEENAIIADYASDWLAALPRDRGGVGQSQCKGFNPRFPPGSTNLNGSHFFADSCNHLHIDVRNRGNTNAQ